MSYAGNWRLQDPTQLATHVHDYISTLLGDNAISFLSWQRSGSCYGASARIMASLYGSMLADSGIDLDFRRNMTHAQRAVSIKEIMRPDSRLQGVRKLYSDVTAGQRQKKRTFVCMVNVFFGNGLGHATMMFVDYRSRTQIFYDGHGRTSQWKALCDIEPLVPGFRVVPADEALDFPGLQDHLERWLDDDQFGTCGLTTLLTLIVARRFNYWHFPVIAMAIREAYPGEVEASLVMQGFVDKYEKSLLALNPRTVGNLSDEDKETLFSALFPPMRDCLVYSESSGRLCRRKACQRGPVQSHCWQHRNIMQSPYRRSKKCVAKF